GGHSVVVPVTGGHVAVAADSGPVGLPGLVSEQAEEDGGHLSTGNVVQRADSAVAVPSDVGVVILRVQVRRLVLTLGPRDLLRLLVLFILIIAARTAGTIGAVVVPVDIHVHSFLGGDVLRGGGVLAGNDVGGVAQFILVPDHP